MYHFSNTIQASFLGIVLDIAGSLALFTGIFGSCVIYGLLGINTRKSD